MISPTRGLSTNRDIVDCMVDIGRKDAQRIECEADTSGISDVRDKLGGDQQTDCPGNLCYTGQEDHLLGEWDPVRRNRQKPARASDMGDACDKI